MFSDVLLYKTSPSHAITMPRRVGILSSHTMAISLSVFLFTFMFLPTLLVLLAVVVFFLFYYPRLRRAEL